MYDIQLTDRERHILALQPERATRGVIYMTNSIDIRSVSGDRYHQDQFTTPFSKNVYYKAKMRGNNKSSIITLDLTLP